VILTKKANPQPDTGGSAISGKTKIIAGIVFGCVVVALAMIVIPSAMQVVEFRHRNIFRLFWYPLSVTLQF
jgi:hypothetical protein